MNWKRIALFVFSFALFIRVGVLIVRGPGPLDSPWDFAFEPGVIANWIVSGEGFSSPFYDEPRPTAVEAPGYPYWLAFIFWMFGPFSSASAWVALSFQSLLGALSCVVIFRLGERLTGRATGFVAAILWAIYPASIYYSSSQIGPTILAAMLFMVVLLSVWRLNERPSMLQAVFCGLLLGGCLLVRPSVMVGGLAAVGWWIVHTSERGYRRVLIPAVVILTTIITIFPWSLRNRLALGSWVPVKTVLGLNLFFGNHPESEGIVQDTESVFTQIDGVGLRVTQHTDAGRNTLRDKLLAMPYQEFAQLDEVSQDRHLRQRALTFIGNEPWRFIKLSAMRFFYFWWPVNPYRATAFDMLRWISYGMPALLAVVAFFTWPVHNGSRGFLLTIMAFSPLTYVITHVSFFRYRFPIEPFLILAAAVTIKKLLELASQRIRLRNSTF